jgi:O-antigen/teichoic acid export membrane protein
MSKSSNKLAFSLSLGKIAAMVLNFVMPVFLSRFLTKEEYGLYSQFYLVHNFVGSICAFGIQSNLYYFFPNATDTKKRQIIWNTLVAISGFGVVGSLCLLIPGVSNVLLNENLREYLNIIILCIIFYIPSLLIDPLGIVRDNKLLVMIYHPLSILLKVAFVVSFALIFHTLDSIFYAILLLEGIIFIFVLFYILRYYPLRGGNFLSLDLMKSQLTYSLPFGIAVCLNTLCMQMDKIICTNYLSLEDYAVYSIAFFGIPGIMQIYDALCQVNVVDMTKYHKNNDSSGVLECYKSFVTKTLSFSFPVILAGCLFSSQIIDLVFSPKYNTATPFFQLYLLTFIFGMIGAGTILRAIGKTKYSMYAFLISTVIGIPTTYLLIRHYGIWGAISSAMINTILPKLLQIIFECRLMKSSFKDYLPWGNIFKIVGISAGLLLPILIFGFFIKWNIPLAIAVSIVYVLIVYLLEIKYDIFLVNKSIIVTRFKKENGEKRK